MMHDARAATKRQKITIDIILKGLRILPVRRA
jgi:hypothetical protein